MIASEIIQAVFSFERLKHLKRTGWVMAGIPDSFRESIADHTTGTAVLSLLIAEALIREKRMIDLEKAVTMAVIHDIGESIISDIPKKATEFDSKFLELKHEAEKKALEELFGKENTSCTISLFHEFLKQETTESHVVKAADRIDMYVHALTIVRAGVPTERVHSFLENIDDFIEEYESYNIIAEIGIELKKLYQKYCIANKS
ncbi:MAG: HD domain-containing protein [Candidatus Lokiarchaeota archaeon]|nr:HD domain-containing protein [Candidatus Lokiarchaeota archaeon]